MTFNANKYDNNELFFDTSSSDYLTKDFSDNVSILLDQSGNDRDGSQGVTVDQPTFISSVYNNLSSVDFDGSSEHIDVTGVSSFLSRTASFTVGLVFRLGSDDAVDRTLFSSTISSTDRFIIQRNSNGHLVVGTYDGSVWDQKTVPISDISDLHFLLVTNNSTDGLRAYLDGVEMTLVSETPVSSDTSGSVVGADTSGMNFWDGLLSELVVYSDNLSSTERKFFSLGLSNKWGVYHPDKIMYESQRLYGERLVKLYEIDATELGGSVYRFSSAVDSSNVITSITYSGTTATVVTETPHTLEELDNINIANVTNESLYNGDFAVDSVTNPTTFTYTMVGTPSANASGSDMTLSRLNNKMVFDGQDYTPVAFEIEGLEYSGQGPQPNPKIRVSNVGKVLSAAVISLNDLVGAKFTRIRTFRKHLDDGSDPDNAAIFPKEIFNINRKSIQNKIILEFELASPMDQEGLKIPARQCIKRVCTHKYRVWNGSSFDYANATCPYNGSSYFAEDDDPVASPEFDKCGKQLNSCKQRFGSSPLPTRAFPGIGGVS